MSILRVKDNQGNIITIPVVKGDKGSKGDPGPTGSTGYTFIPSISASGVLTWSNNGGLPNPPPFQLLVSDVDSSGDDYVRFSCGVQICWGSTSIRCNSSKQGSGSMRPYFGTAEITFPQPFISNPSVSSQITESPAWWLSNASSISTTKFTLYIAGDNTTTTKDTSWMAVGRWS